MENVPPSHGLGWPARGVKMREHEPNLSVPLPRRSVTRSRSPSTIPSASETASGNTSPTASASTSAASSPPQEVSQEVFDEAARAHTRNGTIPIRLPSFRELDSRRRREEEAWTESRRQLVADALGSEWGRERRRVEAPAQGHVDVDRILEQAEEERRNIVRPDPFREEVLRRVAAEREEEHEREIREVLLRQRRREMDVREERLRRRESEHRQRQPQMETIDLTGDDDNTAAQWPPRGYRRDAPIDFTMQEPEWQERILRDAEARLAQQQIERGNVLRPFGQAARGPRFPGTSEIIDLSNDTPVRPQSTDQASHNNNHNNHLSPEIQFLRQRQVSPRRRFAGITPPAAQVPRRLHHTGAVAPIEIPDDDDDIQIIGESVLRHRMNSPPPPVPLRNGAADYTNIFGTITGAIGGGLRAFANRMPPILGDPHGHIPSHLHGAGGANTGTSGARDRRNAARQRQFVIDRRRAALDRDRHMHNIQFVAPALNFGHAAFDLGYAPHDDELEHPPMRPPSPEPVLPPVAEGFTRNPKEEDVLICPNCECELSAEGVEIKRQVWMIKKCGHIYCGECAASRNAKVQKNGKSPKTKPPPLKKCVVDGCMGRTGGKQIIQLFL